MFYIIRSKSPAVAIILLVQMKMRTTNFRTIWISMGFSIYIQTGKNDGSLIQSVLIGNSFKNTAFAIDVHYIHSFSLSTLALQ